MENKKDIGKAISDKLNALDKTPREQVWSGISYELQKKQKRRNAFFFFWAKTIGLIAVGIFAALFIYNQTTGQNFFAPNNSKETITTNEANANSQDNSTTDEERNTKIKVPTSEGIATEKSTITNEKSEANSITSKNASTSSGRGAVKSKNGIKSNENPNSKNTTSTEDLSDSKNNKSFTKSGKRKKSNYSSSKSFNDNSALASKTKKSQQKKGQESKNDSEISSDKENKTQTVATTDATNKNQTTGIDLSSLTNKTAAEKAAEIATKKKDSIAAQKKKESEDKTQPKDSVKKQDEKFKRKFHIDVLMAPTTYGYFSNKSTLDRSLDTLPKKSEIKFGFGFGLTYDLSQRLSVRIGFRKTQINYTTKNAYIGVNSPEGVSNFSGIDYNPEVSNLSIIQASDSEIIDLTQKISYFEIPLEVKYNFLSKKFGLKSSFGFSYLMLDQNVISIRAHGSNYRQDIGKTKKLSTTALSLNLGLEADYPVFENMKIFVEPMLNYQINAFSDGGYKPYLFGVNIGLRYGF